MTAYHISFPTIQFINGKGLRYDYKFLLLVLVMYVSRLDNGVMPDISSAEMPPEPTELRESQYWNQWVAIGKKGILAANPKLAGLIDSLNTAGIGNDDTVTTLFNTQPSDSIHIPAQFLD